MNENVWHIATLSTSTSIASPVSGLAKYSCLLPYSALKLRSGCVTLLGEQVGQRSAVGTARGEVEVLPGTRARRQVGRQHPDREAADQPQRDTALAREVDERLRVVQQACLVDGFRHRLSTVPAVRVRRVPLTEAERSVCDAIAAEGDKLVALASELIGFDTTARDVGDPARDERALQEHLCKRLGDAGAEVDVWEPDADAMHGKPLVPPGLDFAGRPQLIATQRGAGGGRSLVFNGHIDVVSAEPRRAWTSDPFVAQVRDGRLYGRGACDMKGGVAAMVFALEALAALGVRLNGDLLVATNTDEESSGAGGTALVEHGLRADAGIVTEPTGFEVWVACRGSEYGVVRVPGRPGHAEVQQPDWRHGRRRQRDREGRRRARRDRVAARRVGHARGSRSSVPVAPALLPTMARSGEWPVTYPASCELTIAVMYVPAQADERGWGADVRAEVEEWIAREMRPGRLAGGPSAGDRVVAQRRDAVRDPAVGADRRHDPAGDRRRRPSRGAGGTRLLVRRRDADPACRHSLVGYGPPGFDADGVSVAHMVDEYVPVDGLVAAAQGLAVSAMRFCGCA